MKLRLMQPSGIEDFNKREEKISGIYSFEQKAVKFHESYEEKFRKNKKAWNFFQSQVPSYQKPAIHWVMSAKKEETRLKRLDSLIKDSGAGQKIAPLRRNKVKNNG